MVVELVDVDMEEEEEIVGVVVVLVVGLGVSVVGGEVVVGGVVVVVEVGVVVVLHLSARLRQRSYRCPMGVVGDWPLGVGSRGWWEIGVRGVVGECPASGRGVVLGVVGAARVSVVV